MSLNATSLARARISPEERAEIVRWLWEHPGVRANLSYDRPKVYRAALSGVAMRVVNVTAVGRPVDAFRAAASQWDAPEIVSVLS